MSEAASYPPIEPNTFDLIVVGTGLPQSIVAAAASVIGKTVLHLDPNAFYGSHFTSLSPNDLTSFLISHSSSSSSSPPQPSTSSDDNDYIVVQLINRPLYSDVEISSYDPETLTEHSRKFNIDLNGPRTLFCADKAIDLLIKSGASQYVEFKSIDASFVCEDGGRICGVPDSRAAIFKDKSLSLLDKNKLMGFFKLVQQHLEAAGENGGESESSRISDEDLESAFVDFLKKKRLPNKIKSIILYAIAMVDYDQEESEICKDHLLKTKDGINRLAVYHRSVGRFPNAPSAMIYPIYGKGELSQAFCRRAAVKGCIYVLRMPVTALLIDKVNGQYKGVRLASGQDVFSKQIVLDPTLVVTFPLASSLPNLVQEKLQGLSLRDGKKVARGVCITRSSLKAGASNFLLVYPPHSLYPDQRTSLRAVQIGGGLAVCPLGMFVVYFSAICDDAEQGKGLLHAALNALLELPTSESAESKSPVQSEDSKAKPTLLWSALYIQERTTGQIEYLSSTVMPDGDLDFDNLFGASEKLFKEMYPQEEFFPEETSSENTGDDGLSLESP